MDRSKAGSGGVPAASTFVVSAWFAAGAVLLFGEAKLYTFMLLLGMPAAGCFARGLFLVGVQRYTKLRDRLMQRRALIVPAVLASVGAWVIAHFVIDYSHFTDDEQAYIYQAYLYAKGQLSSPILEPREAFEHSFLVPVDPVDGVPQWAGCYPILQPLLMALSGFLGNMHWSNLLCVGILTYSTGRFAERWFDDARVGVIAAWLTCSSPMLLGLGATYHTAILGATLSVVAVRALLWTLDSPGLLPAYALGLCVGALVLTRPMEGALAVLVSVVVLLWQALQLHRAGQGVLVVLRPIVGYGLGGLLPLCAFVGTNLRYTGHPLRGAYYVLEQKIGPFFGFGERVMWGRSHNFHSGLVQTVTAFIRTNAFMYGWPLSLGFVALSLWRPLRDRRVLILLAVGVLQVTGYFFLAFGSVHDFGHAYHVWHIPWVSAITAWVLVQLPKVLAPSGLEGIGQGARYFAAGMAVVALGVFWPVQIVRWYDVSKVFVRHVNAAREAVGEHDAIVLWTTVQPPQVQRAWMFQAPAPLPGAHILWARDEQRFYPELRANFPDRDVYRLTWENFRPVLTKVWDASRTPSTAQ